MKIAVLDTSTIGSDIDLSALKNEGEVIFYEATTPDQTVKRVKNADIVVTNKVIIDKKEFDAAKNLKLICVAATGYNNINVKEANKRDVIVTNVKGYSTESVAQQVFAYLLAFYNSTFQYQNEIKNNKWQQSKVFTMLNHQIVELKGKTLGIIGYGTIGKRVGEIAKTFGMNLMPGKIPGREYKDNSEHYEFEQMLSKSDVISIHTPLTDITKNLIGGVEFSYMKKNTILINYARGGIVNEEDLYQALTFKQIKGAIVDVLTVEPPKKGNILFNAPNIFITPHIAWTSVEARKKLLAGIVKNIQKFKQKKYDEIKILA